MDDVKYMIIGRKVLANYPDLSMLTDEERAFYETWMLDENNRKLFDEMVKTDTRISDLETYRRFEAAKEEKEALFLSMITAAKPAPRIISWWNRRLMYIAAACVLAVISIGVYKFLQPEHVTTNEPKVAKVDDLKPGSYKAKLRLDDGREVYLDSSTEGETLKQGTTQVMNKNGQLVYEQNSGEQKEIFNTLSTRKGETYATVLSDGTKVWLNSASSIRYPVSFVKEARQVEITGEAYFEVAKAYQVSVEGDSTRRPFIVAASGIHVEVLGTEFNINSYADEGMIKTTLVRGKVKVQSANSNKNVFLLPKQAASMNTKTHTLTTASNVDADAAIAWHLGHFQFNDADLETVLRQLVRWYDIDMVVYRAKVPELSFSGTIDRSDNLRQVLTLLEKNGVHFKIEGRNLIVMP